MPTLVSQSTRVLIQNKLSLFSFQRSNPSTFQMPSALPALASNSSNLHSPPPLVNPKMNSRSLFPWFLTKTAIPSSYSTIYATLFRIKSHNKRALKRFGIESGLPKRFSGSDLLSHPAARAVPSAQKSLTSVFGMGTGVTSLLSPPKKGQMLFRFQSGFKPIKTFRSGGKNCG
jgi:hypothetical protein